MKRVMATVLIAALAVGCFSGGVVGTATVNGTYVLQSVNGAALPYGVPGSATKVEILDDAVNLYEGATYAANGHMRSMVNGQLTAQNTSESGTFGLLGNSISFRNANTSVPVVPGTIEGRKMSVLRGELIYIYAKQ